MEEMVSPERAREIVLSHVAHMPTETVPLLEATGRVSAKELTADIASAPFAHAAMDGFALCADWLSSASEQTPVRLKVVADVPAGSVYDGPLTSDECVRIMTGAPLPDAADSVVKYEVVKVEQGDGKTGSVVAFTTPTETRSNVREAGEECHAGDVIVRPGELIKTAGVGFLATCGILEVDTYARPHVAILATGSELVDPDTVPTPGKIRNSNSYALAALVQETGGIAHILPIVEDTMDALAAAVRDATANADFVITTGGAANGDYDFIKQVISELGDLYLTTVNMRPGKAQAFGLVNGVPVFGLPGNPSAAYVGFHMLIRPALRKMQGFSHFEHSQVKAALTTGQKKKDPRRIYLRATLVKDANGGYLVEPAKNQSSGLFGPIQRSNCLAILPEGTGDHSAGELLDCLLLDIPEELVL
ncbi:MAG: molybdopterin molybdotransferase MoeA [Eggerthellaceae bacterium]|nr:molybdopterin molybdotransferase MoeA [Eggerthellaceae bacterium]